MPTTSYIETPNGPVPIPFKGIGLAGDGYLYPQLKKEEHLLYDSIVTILMTKKDQRLFAPNFGSDLWKIVFQPADSVTTLLAEQYIWEALRAWEPRINLTDVRAQIHENYIYVVISYTTITTGVSISMGLQIDASTFRLSGVNR